MKPRDTGGVLAVVVAVLAFSVKCVFAKQYVVGERYCTVPSWSPYMSCDYTSWALQYDFAVGDTLVFNFLAGESNVAEVTKLDYDMCAAQTPTNPKYIYSKPPATITLSTTATFYFISTLNFGCTFQQKLTVTVNGTSSNSPSTPVDDSSPTTSSSSSNNPPTASASSHSSTVTKAVVGSVVGFVFFVAKILFLAYWIRRRRIRQNRNNGQGVPNRIDQPAPVLHLNNRVEMNVHDAIPTNNFAHA